ncbi:MAG: hypothetical protein HC876_16835 [Chloroflexaceae bacterium]|nr:hypothetical protein [Chloroflexaceae bacterium]NJO07045.1 hypothetical protein [Chloroflexaceae bacterium]NJO84117.1 hypothetical protein [Blastochloris sp.]
MLIKLYTFMLGILVLLISACGSPIATGTTNNGAPAVNQEMQISGPVVDTIDDCAFDGLCAYVIETEQGRYNAIWAQGMLPCEGQVDQHIAVGATIEVFGVVTDATSVSICASTDYYIRKTT